MSRKNSEGKRQGRVRAQEEGERRVRTARRRKFAIMAGVPAFLAAASALGVWTMQGKVGGYTPAHDAPVGAVGTEQLAIPVGADDAPATLSVYEDPRCPSCKKFEADYGETINRLVLEGKIKVHYYPVSFLDQHDHGSGSVNGANAMACAQNAGKFQHFHDIMYANQPNERNDVWAKRSVLLDLAKQVPGLNTPEFAECVNKNASSKWVAAVQRSFDKGGFKGTPTVLLDGTPLFPTYKGTKATPENLATWVNEATNGKPPGHVH